MDAIPNEKYTTDALRKNFTSQFDQIDYVNGNPFHTLPNETIRLIETKLNYYYNNTNLLQFALTHSSASNNFNNQQLAWIGDSCLQLILTEEILRESETDNFFLHDMNQIRQRLCNREYCAQCAKHLGLAVIMGKSIHAQAQTAQAAALKESNPSMCITQGSKKRKYTDAGSAALEVEPTVSMLGEAFEAMLGSVYIDSGSLNAVRNVYCSKFPVKDAIEDYIKSKSINKLDCI